MLSGACNQNKMSVDEISARWVIRGENRLAKTVWCDEVITSDDGDDEEVRYGGGGGSCRAFISRFSRLPEYKLQSGQVDLRKLHKRYKIEQLTPNSQLMI